MAKVGENLQTLWELQVVTVTFAVQTSVATHLSKVVSINYKLGDLKLPQLHTLHCARNLARFMHDFKYFLRDRHDCVRYLKIKKDIWHES